jgi:hypothetical protein
MFHHATLEAEALAGVCLFHHEGHHSGPSLCVVGRTADMEKVVARMANIPSLAYMRGAISIYGTEDNGTGHFPVADDVLILLDPVESYAASGAPSTALYWQILERAAELGIIAGRGVPARSTRMSFLRR